jgi:transposase
MLKAAFRPENAICRLHTLRRHQKSLVELGSMHTLHIQKALDGMNLHLHHVLSHVTGVSGLAMLETIVQEERDAKKLAAMADKRVKKNAAEIEAALTGNYQNEELFVLKQSLESYQHCQRQIVECEREILEQLQFISDQCTPEPEQSKASARSKPRRSLLRKRPREENARAKEPGRNRQWPR